MASEQSSTADVYFPFAFPIVDAGMHYHMILEPSIYKIATIQRLPLTSGSTRYIVGIPGGDESAFIDLRMLTDTITLIRIQLAPLLANTPKLGTNAAILELLQTIVKNILRAIAQDISDADTASKSAPPDSWTTTPDRSAFERLAAEFEQQIPRPVGRPTKDAYNDAFRAIESGRDEAAVYRMFLTEIGKDANDQEQYLEHREAFRKAMAYRRNTSRVGSRRR